MERRNFIKTSAALTGGFALPISTFSESMNSSDSNLATRKLFIYGGDWNKVLINYTSLLTSKKTPRICFLPTATGDSPIAITRWVVTTQSMDIKPYVQRLFIGTATHPEP